MSYIFYPRYAVKRLMSLAAIAAAALVQGCATPSVPSLAAQAGAVGSETVPPAAAGHNSVSGVSMCVTPEGCERDGQGLAHGDAIGAGKDAPVVEGRPLTAVVVTQCNLVVAVYMTMPDGRLLRFDNKADVAAEKLVGAAYTATRSERVEVSCESMGPVGYETHGPV